MNEFMERQRADNNDTSLMERHCDSNEICDDNDRLHDCKLVQI